jgi:hypothetical protein
MRAWWILPNRDQRDELLASDGETVMPLRTMLDPKLRPDGFALGVPTELLERAGPTRVAEILFAQRFPRWNGDKILLSISSAAGKDASGRVVHLGLLFVLEPRERPSFELGLGGLSAQDKTHATALIRRLTSVGRGDPWVQSVRDVIDLPSDSGPATNVALERSVVPFEAPYVLRTGGAIRKAPNRLKWTALTLLIVAVLGTWLSVHARTCSAPTPGNAPRQAEVLTGVVSWRFN